jgi:hypothetical protein
MVYVSLNISLQQIEVNNVVGVISVIFLLKLGDKGIPTVNDKGVSLFTVIDSDLNYLGKEEPPYFTKVGKIKPTI